MRPSACTGSGALNGAAPVYASLAASAVVNPISAVPAATSRRFSTLAGVVSTVGRSPGSASRYTAAMPSA